MLNFFHAIIRQAVLLLIIMASNLAFAQQPGQRRTDDRQQQQADQQAQRTHDQLHEVAFNQGEVATDSQLLVLHKEFIAKAEKLAIDFERKKQFDKAREVYASLVRLAPNYATAEEGLSRTLGSQAAQDKQLATVMANQAWQDSGVSLVEGMPVHVEVKGTWTVVYQTSAKGIEIPEDQRPRDNRIKLGTLIAVIANTPAELKDEKPFVVDGGADFIAKKTGRLYLRMFDIDPTDNDGKLLVMIQSTFRK